MRDGIIYDCPNANCQTPIYTGKCKKACIERYNKEMGIKPKTNADRIRAMSDRELADFLSSKFSEVGCEEHNLSAIQLEAIKHNLFCIFMKWLRQPTKENDNEG